VHARSANYDGENDLEETTIIIDAHPSHTFLFSSLIIVYYLDWTITKHTKNRNLI
jgi:hypothetical protein